MKSALINIDVQGPYTNGSPKITKAIGDFTDAARDKMPVIWVCMDWVNLKDAFSAAAIQNPPASVKFKEHMAPTLKIHPKDFIQPKENISVFRETKFKDFLVDQGIEKLYFTGFLASQCLQQSAFDADKNLFKKILLSDLASDGLDETPTKSQLNLYRFNNVEVMNSYDLDL